jgi:hypothetical protein
LNVAANDLLEDAVLGGERGDDGEGAGGVDRLVAGGAVVVEGLVAVGVVAAAVLVADAGLFALLTVAAVETGLVARVRSQMGGAGVGLPDVELVAADALALDVALGAC